MRSRCISSECRATVSPVQPLARNLGVELEIETQESSEAQDSLLDGNCLTFPLEVEHDLVAAFEAAGYSCHRDDMLTGRASGW